MAERNTVKRGMTAHAERNLPQTVRSWGDGDLDLVQSPDVHNSLQSQPASASPTTFVLLLTEEILHHLSHHMYCNPRAPNLILVFVKWFLGLAPLTEILHHLAEEGGPCT